MRKNLRETLRLLQQGGASAISVRHGGRHTHIDFIDPDGEPRLVTIHRGSNPKRYEDCLRSQLRRKKLNI